MTPFEFTPARRENVSLLIGLAGGTGSGKTYSAMAIAKGLAGGRRFAVIDTEAGRAKHYADGFEFDHGDLTAPFEPARYAEAIAAADTAGYPVILVDSFSHEHAGDGGLLDMHEAEYARMGGRDQVKMAAWIKPKMEHRRMMSRLLQVRAHLILCMRAQESVEIVKNAAGRTEIVPKRSLTGLDGWVPIAEKTLPYELTVSMLLTAAAPGVPRPIKVPERLREFFPLGRPVTEATGAALAAWAAGDAAEPVDDDLESVAAELLIELLAAAPGKEAVISAAVLQNRERNVGRLGLHVEWLRDQLVRARAAA